MLGAGITMSQWDIHNTGYQKENNVSFQLYVARRYSPRLTGELNLQYVQASASYDAIAYNTHDVILSPFVYIDLFENRGRYIKRKDWIPYLKTGFSAGVNLGTSNTSSGQQMHDPSISVLQPMIPIGIGVKYRLSRQMDIKLSVIRYENLLGSMYGKNGSVGSINQMECSMHYIIPQSVHCPKFRNDDDVKHHYLRKGKQGNDNMLVVANVEPLIIPESGKTTSKSPIKIRTQLNDLGYWQPALSTDRNGVLTYKAIFPEDITLWKNYVIGLGNKGKQFTNVSLIPSILPLSVKLNTPRFLVYGDQSTVYGNLINFTDQLHKPVHYTVQAGNESYQIDSMLEKTLTLPAHIHVQSADSLRITSTAVSAGLGSDGESVNIPVLYSGVVEARGMSMLIARDTTFTIQTDTILKGAINISASVLDDILNDLEQLKTYPYSCMEQTASKLKGLLLLKNIYARQQKIFTEDKMVNELLKKLETGQRADGSWGWWNGAATDLYMTSYITKVLAMADTMQYVSGSLSKAKAFLQRFHSNDLISIEVILAMSEVAIPLDTGILHTISTTNTYLSDFEKIQRIRILQLNRVPYSINDLLSLKKKSALGGIYWGAETWNWATNEIQATLLAYQILKDHTGYETELQKIIAWFYEKKEHGYWRNTAETAMIADLLIAAIPNTYVPKNVEMIINNQTLTAPSSYKIESNKLYTVSCNTSAPVYLNYYSTQWNKSPEKSGNNFSISTQFIQNGQEVTFLKAGNVYMIQVQVEVLAKAEYCMVEVPVPAGCLQSDKTIRSSNETHRENFKEKTVLYFSYLSPGSYTCYVPVTASYPGSYTLNPAKISLMYFPALYGQESVKTILIKE
ncbi:MAG: hypothetical protein H7259_00590 [Cytophagales bacterium]|nr:hypothetical protein [Cytophaga sp.]